MKALGRKECVLMLGEVIQALVALSSVQGEDGELDIDDRPVREAVQMVVMVERGDLGGDDAVREEYQAIADRSDEVSISTSMLYAVASGLLHCAAEEDVAQALRYYAEQDELWDAVRADLRRQIAQSGYVVPAPSG